MTRTLIIAELGINHNGRLDHALELIAVAKRCGADVAKFQMFSPELLAPGDYERRAMLKGLALTPTEMAMCAAECRKLDIEFCATPMDEPSLDFIVALGVKRIKIGSAQVSNTAFITAVARTNLPVIISAGMCTDKQLLDALACFTNDAMVMYCVSKYPTDSADIHLSELRRLHGLTYRQVGFSSHCPSPWPSVAAAMDRAVVLENHLALPGMGGPDMSSSLLPDDFEAMVREVRDWETYGQ